eukprot:TRINITY_DN2723_c0_g1_i1.p1 TRINITY_DN2723_c0_g1~~TRINITY_DN2723_c0_g1_i1.p1  ORF type:complete len:147 (-),score=23.60 TRINITY_DN2723_c0_g1_i1:63-503(-)
MRRTTPLISRNMDQARLAMRRLYRDFIRLCPRISFVYDIPFTSQQTRWKITNEFRKSADVTEPSVVDYLVDRGRADYIETVSIYKTKAHMWKQLDVDAVSNYRLPLPHLEKLGLARGSEHKGQDLGDILLGLGPTPAGNVNIRTTG